MKEIVTFIDQDDPPPAPIQTLSRMEFDRMYHFDAMDGIYLRCIKPGHWNPCQIQVINNIFVPNKIVSETLVKDQSLPKFAHSIVFRLLSETIHKN
jgi:hypothetical protein